MTANCLTLLSVCIAPPNTSCQWNACSPSPVSLYVLLSTERQTVLIFSKNNGY